MTVRQLIAALGALPAEMHDLEVVSAEEEHFIPVQHALLNSTAAAYPVVELTGWLPDDSPQERLF